MEDTHLKLPPAGNTAPAVNQAYQIARDKLAHIDDILEMCRKTGAKCGNKTSGNIEIQYLGRSYFVSPHDAEISSGRNADTLSAKEKLLILHYLIKSKGTPPSGKLITFQELPDGHVYYPTFLKRSVQPLVSNFSSDPGLLVTLGAKLCGKPAEAGDASFTINAFPRVPVTIVLWRADAEFEARGSILFDAGISDYLPTEDIAVLCETISWRLVKSKPK